LAIVHVGREGGHLRHYLLRRVATLIGIVFVISVGSFFLIHLLPGNPAEYILGFGANPADKAALMKQLGLDQPVYLQYFTWIGHVLQGQFGQSIAYHTSVASVITSALPIDIAMIVMSQILALGTAIPLAMRAARKADGFLDRALSATSFTLLSVPSFIVIFLLVSIASINLHIPDTGVGSYNPANSWITNIPSLLIPAVTLAIGSFVIYFRTLRSDLIATLQEEFITMARAKGLSRSRIYWLHALRPSSVALVGTAGVNIGGQLAAGFVVQYILAIPGLGSRLVGGLYASDYQLVQGIVLVVSIGVILVNFLADFVINLIDPRISRE
jgi:peptide/nickel transport system permease protein